MRERAGLIDRSERGKIEVTGKDRATFLHGLVSNDVKGLAPGQGNQSALLDVHGKVTALLVVHCLADRLVLETDGRQGGASAERDRPLPLLRARRAGGRDGRLGDPHRRGTERAEDRRADARRRPARSLPAGTTSSCPGKRAELRVVRAEEAGEEGYDVWTQPAGLSRLWERLREAGARADRARGVGRAPAGGGRGPVRGRRGRLDAPPGGAARPTSYSLNKGCYLGQEVVARVTYRGHVNRKIVGFRFADARDAAARRARGRGGRQGVGRITSAAVSPALGSTLALGFLRREHWEPGTRVEVQGADEVLAGRGDRAALLPPDARRVSHGAPPAPRARLAHAQPPRRRDEPVPPPAPVQPGRLVPVGRGGAGAGAPRGQAGPALGRLLGLPLVPRHGARVVRGPGRSRGLMNERFVNIKVDREERPDVDSIYMQAVQAMTGHGGWPMTVFLTPDGVPVLRRHLLPAGGPPRHARVPARPRGGGRVLSRQARRGRPGSGQELLERLRQGERVRAGTEPPDPLACSTAPTRGSGPSSTRDHGGLGRAPKFPQPMAFDFLLRYWRRRDAARGAPDGRGRPSPAWRAAASTTSSAAASTATRSTRCGWCPTSRRCSTTTPSSRSSISTPGRRRAIPSTAGSTEETLDYVVREMTHPDGRLLLDPGRGLGRRGGQVLRLGPGGDRGRCSSPRRRGPPSTTGAWPTGRTSRAGASCTCRASRARWRRRSASRRDRLAERLGRARADALRAPRGPHQARPRREGAGGLERDDAPRLRRGVARARTARLPPGGRAERRVPPLARWSRDGRLLRTWKDGRAKLLGYLEDHAMVVDGLLALYEATFDRRWLDAARRLADAMLRPLLGPRGRGLLRHGPGPRDPGRPAARASSTRPCRAAPRWRPTSCSASPS